ncbi:hypothetical protein [Vagococcus sp. CY53-2]|uniref:hypothetical protein n=1 Tax=Vagococcus sp. CY53-2 TaxID=2925780 RepID=UPI001F512269|nr:hypothetical protein [Vagococcus sp. CY53-2]MCI0130034.1 hypothetical protein [Vagococcus sp. CY53-2]
MKKTKTIRTRRQISNTFYKYTELYAELVNRYSYLTDEERFWVIRQFEMPMRIIEEYYFYRNEVLEGDKVYIPAEKTLRLLEATVSKMKDRKERPKK